MGDANSTTQLKATVSKNVEQKFSNSTKPGDAKQQCFVSFKDFFTKAKGYEEVAKKKPNTLKELSRPKEFQANVLAFTAGRACFDWPGLRTGTLTRARLPEGTPLKPGDVVAWGFPNLHMAVYEGNNLFSQLDGQNSNVEFITKDELYKQRGKPDSHMR